MKIDNHTRVTRTLYVRVAQRQEVSEGRFE
ncbi:hypothetical protein Pan189_23540 [Stratiformator vulcanicus]|uniref:Uncharacterized protein n=1 Tax=Stratiformator vulcanicus TaxID=2527980 RepID=A0A517R265_9PLAN|nr:hypothetical protein Pan189_23540 [Stratiformator vulcanicus]